MYRLAILFAVILNASAKIITSQHSEDDDWLSHGFNFRPNNNKRLDFANRQPLWILSLKNENIADLSLRIGTDAEKKYFIDTAGPLIISGLRSRVVKKDNPEKPKQVPALPQADGLSEDETVENVRLVEELFKLINKFALSTSVEPDSYLTENIGENEASIDLYFKGAYTSLIVKLGNRVWHYFINPPSSLPAWFYQMHDINAKNVKVPNHVKNKFYKSLLHLLEMFLGFPI